MKGEISQNRENPRGLSWLACVRQVREPPPTHQGTPSLDTTLVPLAGDTQNEPGQLSSLDVFVSSFKLHLCKHADAVAQILGLRGPYSTY